MGIGSGIFLMAVGAILAYGLTVEPAWLDLDVVGWVLIMSGGAVVVLTIGFWYHRRRASRVLVARAEADAPYLAEVEPRTPPLPPKHLP